MNIKEYIDDIKYKLEIEITIRQLTGNETRLVDYYEFDGNSYQYDELFEITLDIEKDNPKYDKLLKVFPDGRQPYIYSIRVIYTKLQSDEWKDRHPQLLSKDINKDSIKKTTGVFIPKALSILAGEILSI